MKSKEKQATATPPLQSPPLPLAVAAPTRYSEGSDKIPEETAVFAKVVSKSESEEPLSTSKRMIAGLSASPPCAKTLHQDITTDSIKHHVDVDAKFPPSNKNDNIIDAIDSFSRNQNFAEKLHALLSTSRYSSILRWNTNGDAFSIHDIPEFVNTIMPTYFQRSKFDSFTRRMRRWGFRRMERIEERGKGLVIFKCSSFRRDAPALCKSMCDDRQLKKQGISSSASKVVYGYGNVSNYPHREQFKATPPRSGYTPPGPNVVHKGHGEAVPVHFPSGHNVEHLRSYWNPAVAHPPPSLSQHPGPAFSTMGMHHQPAMNPPYAIMDSASHSTPQYAHHSSFQRHQSYPSDMNTSYVPTSMPMIQPPPPAIPMQQDYTNNTMLPYQHHYQHVQSLPPYEHFSGEQIPNQYYMNSYQGLEFGSK